MQNPTQTKEKVDELDLVKFQLLTSYLGMAKTKLSSIDEKREHHKAELELLDYKEKEAQAEVAHVQAEVEKAYAELRTKYAIRAEDALNFATGEITRSIHDTTGKTTEDKAQNPSPQEEKSSPPQTTASGRPGA